MQQVQIQQPQPQIQAAPQFAQIITPNGQIQQVQVLGGLAGAATAVGGQVFASGAGGFQGIATLPIQQQLATAVPAAAIQTQVKRK